MDARQPSADPDHVPDWIDLALDAGRMAPWEITLSTGVLMGSRHLYRLFGIPDSTPLAVRSDWQQFVLEEDRGNIGLAIQRATADGRYEVEFRVRHRDGSVHWLRSVAKAVPDVSGLPARLVGVVQDISDQKQAEAVLRDSQAAADAARQERRRLLDVLESLPVIITLLRPDYTVAWGNRAYREAFGDNVGKPCFASQFGREEPCTECQASTTLTTGSLHEWESTLPDGRTLHIYNVPFADVDGSPMILEVDIDITERKRAEAAFREFTETRYRMLRETLRDAFVQVSMDGRIVDCNDQYCEMLDYTAEEVRELTYQQLTPERWHAAEDRIVREQIISRGYSDVYEKEYRRKDGTIIPVELRTILSRDQAGQPAAMWATVRDISERKRGEDALSESERKYRSIFENSLDAIFLAVPGGAVTAANPAACAIFGMTEAELCAAGRAGIEDPKNPPPAAAFAERQLKGRVRYETIHVRKDGSTFPSEVSSVITDEGARSLVILRDITERKRVETELRESERRLAGILEQVPVGVGLTNVEGRWILSNSRMRDFAPSVIPSRDAERGSRWRAFDDEGHPLDPGDYPAARALRGETVVPGIEFQYAAGDGRDRWMRIAAAPFLNAHGETAGAVTVAQDITVEKLAQLALADADQRKSEFIAVLSHELRNPLAPIRYAVPVLQREPLSEPAAHAVAIVERQVRQLARHVDDLLDITRIASGKIELRQEHVTLASVLTTAIEAASPAIAAGLHTLTTVVPDEPMWLRADSSRAAQIVTNLLDNAAKYTPKGGHVALEASREGRHAVIAVRDDGIGIPVEELGTIFEMFHQVRRSDRSVVGLGIGLALVKRLVEMHGGTIQARSGGAGHGAEFTVRLPLADESDLTRSTNASTVVPLSGRTFKVLIVDDNADLVELLGNAVSTLGHDVRKAFDGSSALSAAQSYRPDVVLLDLGLPVMDGIEVARRLRQMPETAEARLVAVTGWGQEEDRRQTREVGFDAHLTKPADPAILERLLAEFAAKRPVEK